MKDRPPSDAEIRPALRRALLAEHAHETEGAVILEELGVMRGFARIDMAVVNGAIHAFEIKSDRDSLRRLAGQVDLFGKVFDRATLVVGRRHLSEAMALIPQWWGVVEVEAADSGLAFRTIRPADENPARDARVLAELLWLEDAVALLESHGLERGVKGKPRRIVWDRISACLDVETIAAAVRVNLKARKERLRLEELSSDDGSCPSVAKPLLIRA